MVFIRELVRAGWPSRRWRGGPSNEPYLAVPMSHDIALDPVSADGRRRVTLRAGAHQGGDYRLAATVATVRPSQLVRGSEAEFITEHYWGYTRQRDGGTLEYHVQHPALGGLAERRSGSFTGSAEAMYGANFAAVLAPGPRSTFVAVGSEVAVHGRPSGGVRSAPPQPLCRLRTRTSQPRAPSPESRAVVPQSHPPPASSRRG